MFVFHKILPTLILPLGLCIGFLFAALVWRRKILVAVPLLVLALASNPWISSFLMSRLENYFPKIEIIDAPKADAVVVLSGILGEKRSALESPELNWGDAYDRFDAGVRLIHAGKAPLLVFFNPRIPWKGLPDFDEGDLLMRSAMERGVQPEKIILLGPVSNTADEARLISREAKANGWRSVILVTTAWHMPRAWKRFYENGVNVIPFPVDFRSNYKEDISLTDFFPTASALHGTEIFIREFLGRSYYFIYDNARKNF